MRIFLLILFFFASLTASEQKFARIAHFTFENGSVADTLLVGYRTFGNLNDDSSNVIVLPTYFSGRSASVSNLVGPGKLIDSTHYYIIIVDALGNGVSASPSNFAAMPAFTIGDMVQSQYLLLTAHFKFKKVYALLGGSMGGMQVFEWQKRYPWFFSKAVSYVSTPRPAVYDQHYWGMQRYLIESGRATGLPDSVIRGNLNLTQNIQATSPDYINDRVQRDEFDSYFEKMINAAPGVFTIDNWLAQVNAMLSLNALPGSDSKWSSMKERFLIIVSANDRLVTPQPAISYAKTYDCSLVILENECGHYAVGCELARCAHIIENFLQ